SSPARWLMESIRALAAEDPPDGLEDPSMLLARDLDKLKAKPWFHVLPTPVNAAADTDPADGHEYNVRSVARHIHNGCRLSVHWLAADPGSSFGRSLRLEGARRSREWTEFDGNLAGVWPSNAGLTDEVASATRYEAWATCPFQYFLSHVLNLTPVEAPEEQFTVSSADRGTLVHRILQRFVSERGFGKEARRMNPDEQARLLERVVDQECADFASRAVSGKPAMWRMETRRLKRDLERFIKNDELPYLEKTGAEPAWTELAFGRGEDGLPAAEVELDDGSTVRFRGVIDRVDVSADGRTAYVLDYKSSRSGQYSDPGLVRESRAGRLLQLPVYARAIAAGRPAVEEIKSHYWFVFSERANKLSGGAASEFDEPMAHALGVIASGISSGVFPARPGGPAGGSQARSEWQNCGRCDFDRVCPARRDRQWERKKGDEGLRAYRELAEDGGA
ncbi:MAG: PD-(D/E)XK nuclease family protein, partial [Chloroflexota bacterium]